MQVHGPLEALSFIMKRVLQVHPYILSPRVRITSGLKGRRFIDCCRMMRLLIRGSEPD